MLPVRVSANSKEPIYYQIEIQIKALIVAGKLKPQTLLPSIRALSSQLACSVITTRRAYQNLEQEGYIQTIQGKGTYVCAIDEQTRRRTIDDIVSEEFVKAIEQARQLGCTDEEIQHIFENVLME